MKSVNDNSSRPVVAPTPPAQQLLRTHLELKEPEDVRRLREELWEGDQERLERQR